MEKRRILPGLAVLILMVFACTMQVSAAAKNGWQKESGVWYYYDDGLLHRGWLEYEGNTYYMNPEMLTGMQEINGPDDKVHRYYFGTNGIMVTGWKKIDDKWYYFHEDGMAADGINEIDGKLYCFTYMGEMQIGDISLRSNGEYYYAYALSNGTLLKNAFLEQPNRNGKTIRSFIGEDGKTLTGLFTLEGEYPLYVSDNNYPDTTGSAVKKKTLNTNATYYGETSVLAKDAFVTTEEKTYYFNSDYKRHAGFLNLEGKVYYFNEDGSMLTGDATIDGKTYRFDSKTGAAYTGWLTESGGRKYYDENGVLCKGFFDYDWKPVWSAEKTQTLGGAGEYMSCYDYTRNHPNENCFSSDWPETTNYLIDSYGISIFYADPETGIVQTGLQEIDGKTYLFEESGTKDSAYGISYKGAMHRNDWEKTERGERFFDREGVLNVGLFQTDYQKFQGRISRSQEECRYYADDNGYCMEGWIDLPEGKRYFAPYMAHDQWIDDNGKVYYVDQSGEMQTGFISIVECYDKGAPYDRMEKGIYTPDGDDGAEYKRSRRVYYLGTDGVRRYGRIRFPEGIREFDNTTGVMRTGTTTFTTNYADYDKETGLVTVTPTLTYIQFDVITGILQTGFVNVCRQESEYNSDRIYTEGLRYIDVDGVARTGWQVIDGKTYYFADNTYTYDPSDKDHDKPDIEEEAALGIMAVGWKEMEGSTYFFRSGVMQTGWKTIGGKLYHFEKDGKMTTKWYQEDAKWYYLDPAKGMITGWKQMGKYWYFFRSDGAMHTGWKKLSNAWYYFDKNGRMQVGWKQIDGKWYHFTDEGRMSTGWYEEKGAWYFLKNGAMQTGWCSIGGKWYYFYKNGKMAANTIIGGYKINKNGVCMNP